MLLWPKFWQLNSVQLMLPLDVNVCFLIHPFFFFTLNIHIKYAYVFLLRSSDKEAIPFEQYRPPILEVEFFEWVLCLSVHSDVKLMTKSWKFYRANLSDMNFSVHTSDFVIQNFPQLFWRQLILIPNSVLIIQYYCRRLRAPL